jgi:hypothetical protein
VLCWLAGAISIVLHAVLRIGFGVDWTNYLSAFSVLNLLVLGSPCLHQILHSRRLGRPAGWLTAEAVTIGLLAALCMLGWLAGRADVSAAWAVWLLGSSALTWWVVQIRRRHLKEIAVLAVLSVLIVTAFYVQHLGRHLGYLRATPTFREEFGLGEGCIDSLFHASIAQMIKSYGLSSVGLHGVPYLPYHWGSHWIFAQLSSLLRMTPLDVYNVVVPTTFYLPLMLSAVCRLAVRISRLLGADIVLRPWSPTGTAFFGSILLLPVFWMPAESKINWLGMPLGLQFSESFGVAMIVALNLAAWCLACRDRPRLVMWVSIGALACIGLLKISVLAMGMIAWWFFWLGGRCWRCTGGMLGGLVQLASFAGIGALTVSPQSSRHAHVAFDYWHHIIVSDWAGWYPLLHYGPLLLGLLAGWWLRRRGGAVPGFYFALPVLLMFGGEVPGNVFDLNYAGEFFAKVASIFGWAMLLGSVPVAVKAWTDSRRGRTSSTPGAGVLPGLPSLPVIVAAAVILPAPYLVSALTTLGEVTDYHFALRDRLVRLRNLHASDTQPPFSAVFHDAILHPGLSSWRSLKESMAICADAAHNTARFKLVQRLSRLDRMSPAAKRESLVLVPRSFEMYWEFFGTQDRSNCLLVPALTGIAAYHGAPPPGANTRGYGFELYSMEAAAPPPAAEKDIAAECAGLNLRTKRIYVIERAKPDVVIDLPQHPAPPASPAG